MPWGNQNGGNGTGPSAPRGPWGRGPEKDPPSGSGPPDFEDFLRRGQDRLRRYVPSGGFTAGTLAAIALIVLGFWLASGVYFVSPDEEGVVLRFGAVDRITDPGMKYHLPWPIEVVYTPKVKNENKINVGYQPTDSDSAAQLADVSEESHMLTGDENIVDVNFTVYWKIKDAAAYLFNVPRDSQEATIKAVAESAMREVVGENQIERIQTSDREQLQLKVRELMQKTIDLYRLGVLITRINMQKADPPGEVIAAYRDVQAARADQDRKRNEAEAYANTIIPQARGQAAHIVQDAEAYRQQVIAESSGQAKRFLSVYEQYRKAPEVTRKRMYLETMSQVFARANKVIVDDSAKGVVPYFQLPNMQRPQAPQPDQGAARPQQSGGTVVQAPSADAGDQGGQP
jgi:modulator of FtsH protease HflK